ncbi:MAG: hypothetical protein R2865_12595 [Deinococcales bacterium]
MGLLKRSVKVANLDPQLDPQILTLLFAFPCFKSDLWLDNLYESQTCLGDIAGALRQKAQRAGKVALIKNPASRATWAMGLELLSVTSLFNAKLHLIGIGAAWVTATEMHG